MQKTTGKLAKRVVAIMLAVGLALPSFLAPPLGAAEYVAETAAASDMAVVSNPYFMDYAVFDMLDLRGIQIAVPADPEPVILTAADITPEMISWVDGRDLNYRADFIADQSLDNVYRTLIITHDGLSTTLDIPVKRYAFHDGTRFVVHLAPSNPINGGVGEVRNNPATPVWHHVFGDPSFTALDPSGALPDDVNIQAIFEIVHNRGNQVGYGILSVDRNLLLDAHIHPVTWALGVWADSRGHWGPDAANNDLLWRIVRLPNGYHAIKYVGNDGIVHAPGVWRAAAIGPEQPGRVQLATPNNNNETHAIPFNPDDPTKWFVIHASVIHPAHVTSVVIEPANLYANPGQYLRVSEIQFDPPYSLVPIAAVPLQWFRVPAASSSVSDWIPIAGATDRYFRITDADLGYSLAVAAVPDGVVILGDSITDRVFSTPIGPIAAATYTRWSDDIASIRMIEMGYIEIRWRDRMAFNAAIPPGQNPINQPATYYLTIGGQRVAVTSIQYYEWPINVPTTFMTSMRVVGWESIWDDFQINQRNHPGSVAPNFYSWLNYDIAGDPLNIFEWCDVEEMWFYIPVAQYVFCDEEDANVRRGGAVNFDVELRVTQPLARHAEAGGTTINTATVYSVKYVPVYQ
ncbi:MAG: hypothetical protein FWC93_07710, partial [Defluviitaleaceae bacterium]|nr:hypothetical protein [Defluviitaleaceae bacterium]